MVAYRGASEGVSFSRRARNWASVNFMFESEKSSRGKEVTGNGQWASVFIGPPPVMHPLFVLYTVTSPPRPCRPIYAAELHIT